MKDGQFLGRSIALSVDDLPKVVEAPHECQLNMHVEHGISIPNTHLTSKGHSLRRFSGCVCSICRVIQAVDDNLNEDLFPTTDISQHRDQHEKVDLRFFHLHLLLAHGRMLQDSNTGPR